MLGLYQCVLNGYALILTLLFELMPKSIKNEEVENWSLVGIVPQDTVGLDITGSNTIMIEGIGHWTRTGW